MKKSVLLVLSVLFCLCFPYFAAAESNTVTVEIPGFSVTVNGIEYNSNYSEFPFLLYNDITYLPMTYDFATFMGLNITFKRGVNNVYHKDEMILHIGNGERTAPELGQYLKKEKNKTSYQAVIPDYHTYISFERKEYDNDSLYPMINFNGVTYLPMTWNVIHTLLDWEYSFDSDSGLVINSTGAVRPYGVNRKLFNRMATSTNEYVFGENWYLSYDINIYRSGKILWVTGEEEKEYDLTEQLRGKVDYLNRMYKDGVEVRAETPPKINGNLFEIMCARKDFGEATVLVTVDLTNGVVLSTEVLSCFNS